MSNGIDQPAQIEQQRQARQAWEDQQIQHAMAQAERGEMVDLEEIQAWIDSWETPGELPKPRSRPPV